ncbi:C4-dicarboxylate ABC transporter [Allostella sp. ATCC 35155]|nr:C4-dicarboxylate ABC transporter [Stella sp. ATCC 35155]
MSSESSDAVARIVRQTATLLAIAMSVYHLYVGVTGAPEAFFFRGAHLMFTLVLIFLIMPSFRRKVPHAVDYLMMVLSVAAIGYLWANHDYLYSRFVFVDDPTTTDLILGTILVLIVLESTRRVIGLALPITAILFVVYGLAFGNMRPEQFIEMMYLTTEGIFGIPLGVSATYVILFIIFGAFVERSGTGQLFMDSANAVAGHTAGGPAKVAVITSGLFGTISGSAVANVMTTGTFTIPMMQRIGYRPAFAGAVEAVASTGGQIMPPIMGAAAFVMAEFLGASYLQITVYALIPAVLYYWAVFAAVHLEARRVGMRGMPRDEMPAFLHVLTARGHLFVPLVTVVAVLFMGYSAPYAAVWGVFSVVPIMLLRQLTRRDVSFAMIMQALESGARSTLAIAAACACAGIVIGVIAQTGLGLTFTSIVIAASQDSLVPALVLTMLAGIVLGMGLPTTPAYIIQVALLVPALIKLGVVAPAAHMFVFYFAILSAITPPVALAVYAAIGLSKSPIWETGLAAVKLGATGYIVPFMFVFSPELLMIGDWPAVAAATFTATIGVTCLASSLHGFALRPLDGWQRVVLLAGALALIKPGLMTDLIGAGCVLLVIGTQLMARRAEASG